MTLTFKKKIALVILITVICTLALAGSSLLALRSILQANDYLARLTEVADSSMELQIELYAAGDLRGRLSPDTYEPLREQIRSLQTVYRSALMDSADAITEVNMKPEVDGLISDLDTHLATLSRWLKMRETYGLTAQSGLQGALNSAAEQLNDGVSNFSGLSKLFQAVRQSEKDFLLNAKPEHAKAVLEVLAELRRDLVDFDFEKYVAQTDLYRGAFVRLTEHYGLMLVEEQLLSEQIQFLIERSGALEHYLEDDLRVAATASAQTAAGRARPSILLTGGIALVLVILLLVTTGRSANRGLMRTMDALRKVADGDLRVQVKDHAKDEFGDLARTVNLMSRELSALVSHVATSSEELSDMARQQSAAVDHIARGNRQVVDQATSLAAATEQMSATVAEVAETTHQVNDATRGARQAATDGSAVISRSIRALDDVAQIVAELAQQMNELGQRSERIDRVIVVIRGVAEQTNLLALNAAIEAARAGEAGRGFAVVADEVRNLAGKTVQASDEITQIVHELQQSTRDAVSAIEGGRERAVQGNAHGAAAAEAVTAIEQQVVTASERTGQIAVAIEELASTVKDMAHNMESISCAVNDSSGQTQAIVDSAQQVAGKASDLQQLTLKFRV